MTLLNKSILPTTSPGHFVRAESVKLSWKKIQERKGELILIKSPGMVKNKWSCGRINQVFPNTDGMIRCVEVRMPDGSLFLCDISKIYKLECEIYDQFLFALFFEANSFDMFRIFSDWGESFQVTFSLWECLNNELPDE